MICDKKVSEKNRNEDPKDFFFRTNLSADGDLNIDFTIYEVLDTVYFDITLNYFKETI